MCTNQPHSPALGESCREWWHTTLSIPIDYLDTFVSRIPYATTMDPAGAFESHELAKHSRISSFDLSSRTRTKSLSSVSATDDAVRPTVDEFRTVYEQSFSVWSRLYIRAVENFSLPTSCLSIPDAFCRQPSFPRDLRLKHAGIGRVYATGSSTWGSSQADCQYGLPPFQQALQIEVAVRDPISLSIAQTPDGDISYASWFARGDQNFLAVLILAWAYVLSARWIDVMPGPCSLSYTSAQTAGYDEDATISQEADKNAIGVDMGDASSEEARWWAAVLAPGQGWQATIAVGQETFLSPWSICLRSSPRFFLSRSTTSPLAPSPPRPAPSFSEACRFLDNFCMRYNLADQSHAALAAVLLFPSMGGGRVLQIPAATVNNWRELTQITSPPASQHPIRADRRLGHDWLRQENHLDGLLTLSCHTRGIRPMLLSVFYDAGIGCNAVTPWLQGAVAAIDSLAGDRPLVLGRMFMDRSPGVAFLWLGATILGLQKKLLQDVRLGFIPIDLHSAAWSGTIQSFIQQPVSKPLVVGGYVARADECRLLFLSQSGFYSRVPVCQWRPFGVTPLGDTDIGIRIHAECEGHGLQYQGFSWDCANGKSASPPVDNTDICISPTRSPTQHLGVARQTPVSYGALDREKEFASENATRSIFGWLRVEGYASNEKEIWRHQWFEILDSDEEEQEQNESTSRNRSKSSSHVESWLSDLSSSLGA